MHTRYVDLLPIDYFTCLGVIYWATSAPPTNMTPFTLQCARHDCSCTAHDVYPSDPGGLTLPSERHEMMLPKVTSNITIDGKPWELPAPPLTIGLTILIYSSPRRNPATALVNSIDFWADARSFTDPNTFYFNGRRPGVVDAYWNNGTVLDRRTIEHTGRCVSEDAYQWGFSSLLLLTFCSATIAFAAVLILLQTDVYWNSRSDRFHQSHSLYADVLFLTEELKAAFGRDSKDTALSPDALRKQVERRKQGLGLDVDELPMSRWQERQLSRAAKAAARKAEHCATESTGSPTHELRALSARDAEQGPKSLELLEKVDSAAVHEESKLEDGERDGR